MANFLAVMSDAHWFDWAPIWDGQFADFLDVEDIYNSLMSLFCVTCAALAAGLTMGLLSLDVTKLELKTITGTPDEKRQAKTVLPIVKRHHLLLVTLLLFNSISNESLPIFLGALFPNYIAILVSVTMVLIFGEIIPSALFTGPVQLSMASAFSPLVIFLMTIFWPVAYPISKILDYVFGAEEHTSQLSRDEFEALVMLQGLSQTTHDIVGLTDISPSHETNIDHINGHDHDHENTIYEGTEDEEKGDINDIHKPFQVTSSSQFQYTEDDNNNIHDDECKSLLHPDILTQSSLLLSSSSSSTTHTAGTKNQTTVNSSSRNYHSINMDVSKISNNENVHVTETSALITNTTTTSVTTNATSSSSLSLPLSSRGVHTEKAVSQPIPLTPQSGPASYRHNNTFTQRHQAGSSNKLSKEELSIMTGVLKLRQIMIKDIMIPKAKMSMLSDTTILDEETLKSILETGYSRIPVYKQQDTHRIRGYLLVKSLAVLNPKARIPIKFQNLREPIFLKPTTTVLEALTTFRRSRCHLALVTEDPLRALRCMRSDEFMAYSPKILGIVTMEDTIEEIIQNEILDETDVLLDTTTMTSGRIQPMYQNVALRRKSDQYS